MKTNRFIQWLKAFVAAALTATAAYRSSADETAVATAKPEKTYTGMVSAVDAKEQRVNVSNWPMFRKDFNLGTTCVYRMAGKENGTINDLRPGEKVTVSYQEAQGVLIADRVEQLPMQFEGRLTAMNITNHEVTVHQPGLDKQLDIGGDCKVTLLKQRTGAMGDIRAGDHVVVTYEMPDGTPTVREIAQTSIEFTGTLTAIDLGEKTLKAETTFDSKKFTVADDCTIVINGWMDGRLSDLKLNDKVSLSYDEINGLNVVNRIGVTDSQANTVASTAPPSDD